MQYQPNELKQFINEALVAFVNDSLIPLVNALVAGTIPADSVYTAAIQNDAVTLAKLGADVTAAALGAPSKVNGVEPDSSGDIVLTGGDIAMSSTDSTTVAGAISTKQTQTGLLAVENDIADADYLPFYDTSAADSRRTLWSNIVSKIRAAFQTTALPVDSGGTGGCGRGNGSDKSGCHPCKHWSAAQLQRLGRHNESRQQGRYGGEDRGQDGRRWPACRQHPLHQVRTFRRSGAKDNGWHGRTVRRLGRRRVYPVFVRWYEWDGA